MHGGHSGGVLLQLYDTTATAGAPLLACREGSVGKCRSPDLNRFLNLDWESVVMGEKLQIRSGDGFELGAYSAAPGGSPRGSVVVIQEIFGVNGHIREVADGYAQSGYFAIAPQLFDRLERDVALGYEGADMQRGIELAAQKLDRRLALQDLQATLEVAAEHAGGRGVGVVGYCFGGLMS